MTELKYYSADIPFFFLDLVTMFLVTKPLEMNDDFPLLFYD